MGRSPFTKHLWRTYPVLGTLLGAGLQPGTDRRIAELGRMEWPGHWFMQGSEEVLQDVT